MIDRRVRGKGGQGWQGPEGHMQSPGSGVFMQPPKPSLDFQQTCLQNNCSRLLAGSVQSHF